MTNKRTSKTAKIQVGNHALIGKQLIEVVSPYKVRGHWTIIVLEDYEDVHSIGQIRIVSGGTIALHRVKRKTDK